MNDGNDWIVDIDLEKFFDTVNHDKLMTIIGRTIKDGDVISIIRKYLVSGIMIDDEYEDSVVGTPQGGNLSPLLANIMLNELDKEMEKRGLNFVRYADDCIIMVLMKWIPNAALMGNMAAGALVWLSLNGFVTVFETPLVSVIPLFLIFLAQKMKKPLIKGIPNTVLIVGTGVALAWLTGQCNIVALQKSAQTFGVYPPQLSILDVTKGISQIGP